MAKAKRRGKHEGCRYRRKDGLFVGRVRFEGRRYQVSSADRLERDRLLRALIRDLDTGTTPANEPRRVLVRTVVDQWLADRALATPATVPTWRSYAQHILEAPIADRRVAGLTAPDVTAWLTERRAAGYASSTVRQMHRTLRAALNWAVEQGVPVPATVLRAAPPAVDDVERVQFTPQQVRTLFASLRDRADPLEAAWRLCWYTALRLGELLALAVADLEYTDDGGLIRVRRILIKSTDGEPRCRAGKTKSSRAALAIPPDAARALRAHLERQEERRAALGPAWRTPAVGRLLFDRGDGGAYRHEQAEAAWYDAVKLAGLPRCRPHDLRGAALSALREAGHDVLDVQRRARHARVATTIESYVRATDDADRRAAATLERLVAGA
jgi:integrase